MDDAPSTEAQADYRAWFPANAAAPLADARAPGRHVEAMRQMREIIDQRRKAHQR